MRDYPNGGFFFIDAAPIQAAGEEGLKIDGIFEDAKRAISGGKVFVLANFAPDENTLITGVMTAVNDNDEEISAGMSVADGAVAVMFTPEDVVTIGSN